MSAITVGLGENNKVLGGNSRITQPPGGACSIMFGSDPDPPSSRSSPPPTPAAALSKLSLSEPVAPKPVEAPAVVEAPAPPAEAPAPPAEAPVPKAAAPAPVEASVADAKPSPPAEAHPTAPAEASAPPAEAPTPPTAAAEAPAPPPGAPSEGADAGVSSEGAPKKPSRAPVNGDRGRQNAAREKELEESLEVTRFTRFQQNYQLKSSFELGDEQPKPQIKPVQRPSQTGNPITGDVPDSSKAASPQKTNKVPPGGHSTPLW